MKGKDMILKDFLSLQKNDDGDPCELIPISFNAYGILKKTDMLIYVRKMKKNS